jgi:hypothetical protein
LKSWSAGAEEILYVDVPLGFPVVARHPAVVVVLVAGAVELVVGPKRRLRMAVVGIEKEGRPSSSVTLMTGGEKVFGT